MVVSVTLGFLLNAFVRQSEGFSKKKKKEKKRPIYMVNFLFEGDFVCVYVCLSFCAFEC